MVLRKHAAQARSVQGVETSLFLRCPAGLAWKWPQCSFLMCRSPERPVLGPAKQLMALPLAAIRVTYPEKLIIQIVKSPISQANRGALLYSINMTLLQGTEGPPAPVAFLLQVHTCGSCGPALRRLACGALSGI